MPKLKSARKGNELVRLDRSHVLHSPDIDRPQLTQIAAHVLLLMQRAALMELQIRELSKRIEVDSVALENAGDFGGLICELSNVLINNLGLATDGRAA